MTDPRRGRVLIHMLMVAALGGALLAIGAVTVFAADPIEATGNTLAWSNSTQTIAPGGMVEFKNSSGLMHGVNFRISSGCTKLHGGPDRGHGGSLERHLHLYARRALPLRTVRSTPR